MANIKSAEKRNRQNKVRYERNHAKVSRIRTFLRKVEEAITSGNKDSATTSFKEVQPELHKGVSRGLLHRNTVARKLSRLSARIKSID